ncbi:MAG: hypothetical protein CL912_14800 [Deltaproteobacteria bacterium]|nr:hypothetical protein [Deltaproteobacteria bacterium]
MKLWNLYVCVSSRVSRLSRSAPESPWNSAGRQIRLLNLGGKKLHSSRISMIRGNIDALMIESLSSGASLEYIGKDVGGLLTLCS